jgi:hypothetical protein
MKRDTREVFEYWRTKLSEARPTEGGPAEAWQRVDELKSSNGTELLSAMLKLHDSEDQSLIIKRKEHQCEFLDNCPLDHINQQDDNEIFDSKFGDYLKALTKSYFIDTYFYSRPAKIGLNILTRMYSDGPINLNLHPLGLLKSALARLDHYSPVVEKPDFKRRERRDSIVSSGTSSGHSRKKS